MPFKRIAVAAALSIAFATLGCSPKDEGKLVIGFSMNSLKDPFLLSLKQGAEKAAGEHKVKLIVTESQANLAKQINAVEDLIQRDVDILGINPVDARGIVPAVEAANKAGIPLITVDTDALGGKIETFVGSDNVMGGRLAGEYIVARLGGKGKVAVLDDVPGKSAIIDRIEGFKTAVRAAPSLEIVTIQPAYGRRDMAMTVVENILQAHPEIDAIFAACDAMALGALDVLESTKSGKELTVVGFDASAEALDSIRKGRLNADIAQFPDEMGRKFIEAAVRISRGESLPRYIHIPVVTVIKDNVDSFRQQ